MKDSRRPKHDREQNTFPSPQQAWESWLHQAGEKLENGPGRPARSASSRWKTKGEQSKHG